MDIELIHFGDDCASGIIINDILKIKKKQLFMLGIFEFNQILNFIENNDYNVLFNKSYFNKIQNDIIEIIHPKFKFRLNHDYRYDDNNNIINYDQVKTRFIEKISNFNQCLTCKNNLKLFINFTNNNVNNLDLEKFKNIFNKIDYKLVIFTNNDFNNKSDENIYIIKLNNKYNNWYEMEYSNKHTLYLEIYQKFLNFLESSNIINTLNNYSRNLIYKNENINKLISESNNMPIDYKTKYLKYKKKYLNMLK